MAYDPKDIDPNSSIYRYEWDSNDFLVEYEVDPGYDAEGWEHPGAPDVYEIHAIRIGSDPETGFCFAPDVFSPVFMAQLKRELAAHEHKLALEFA